MPPPISPPSMRSIAQRSPTIPESVAAEFSLRTG
jgi:hypothetical protein